MALEDRQRPSIRLTPHQDKSLDRVVRWRGTTKQSYMQAAVMRAVDEDLAQMRQAGEDRQRRREEREGRRGGGSEPMGLGIRPRGAPVEDLPPIAAPPGQVVVNVGGAAQGEDAELARFADYVAGAPAGYERDRRTEEVLKILGATTGSREELAGLAQKLDAAVLLRSAPKERPGGILERLGAERGAFSSRLKELLAI